MIFILLTIFLYIKKGRGHFLSLCSTALMYKQILMDLLKEVEDTYQCWGAKF
jgi:hypothetical protein